MKDALATLTPLLHEDWWFMTSYFILYILSPFANQLWDSMTDKQRKLLLFSLG